MIIREKEGFMSRSDKLLIPASLNQQLVHSTLFQVLFPERDISRQNSQRDNHSPRIRDTKDIRKTEG